MKLRTILFIFLGLGILVVLGNGLAGSLIADKLDEQIKSSPALIDSGYEIAYDELSVNPLFAQILVRNLRVENKFNASKIRAKSLHGSLAYHDLFAFDGVAGTWDLTSLSLDCDSLDLGLSILPGRFRADRLTLDFEGALSQENFGPEAVFPQKKQRLKLNGENIRVPSASRSGYAKWVFAIIEAVSEAEDASGEIIWHPSENKIEMRAIHAENGHMTFDYGGELRYRGHSPSTYEKESLSDNFHAVFSEPGVTLTPPTGGSYFAEKGVIDGKLTREFNEFGKISGLPQGEMTADLEAARVVLPQNIRERMKGQILLTILRLSGDEIPLKSVDIVYRRTDDRMTFENTSFAFNLFTASLDAIVWVDDESLETSRIGQGRLALSELAGTLNGALKMYESLSGNKLPRENEAIVFPVTGTLGAPKLKGLPF